MPFLRFRFFCNSYWWWLNSLLEGFCRWVISADPQYATFAASLPASRFYLCHVITFIQRKESRSIKQIRRSSTKEDCFLNQLTTPEGLVSWDVLCLSSFIIPFKGGLFLFRVREKVKESFHPGKEQKSVLLLKDRVFCFSTWESVVALFSGSPYTVRSQGAAGDIIPSVLRTKTRLPAL